MWGPLPQSYERRRGKSHLEPCVVVGCERLRHGPMLCPLHLSRWRTERPLIADHDQVGVRESGHGVYGIVIATDEAALCYECGRWYRMLTAGHLRTHGLTPDQYRERHGLPRRVGLCAGEYSAAHREKALRRPDLLAAGADRLRELAVVGSAAAAVAGVSDAGKAARAAGLRRARADQPDRPCPVCGGPMPKHPQSRRLRVCSPECASASMRAGAWRRDAREAGEPLDWVRRPGTGRRLGRDDVAAQLGVRSVRSWLASGDLDPHDGRTDGSPWWWSSTVEEAVRRRRQRAQERRKSPPP